MEANNENMIVEPKKLSMLESMKYFFIKPNKLFEAYSIKPTWGIKLIITMILGIVYILTYVRVILLPQVEVILQQTGEFSMKEIDAAAAFLQSPIMTVLAIIAAILMIAISVFFVSLVYYGLISLFGGKTKYMKIVAVYLLAFIPFYIGNIIKLLFAHYSNFYEAILQPRISDVFFDRFGLFVIWQVLILVFGFAKVSNIKLSKSAIVVGIMWMIATAITLAPVFMNRMF